MPIEFVKVAAGATMVLARSVVRKIPGRFMVVSRWWVFVVIGVTVLSGLNTDVCFELSSKFS